MPNSKPPLPGPASPGEQNDDVPPEQLEELESVAVEIAHRVRRHLPNPFMVDYRVVNMKSGCVILSVQTPMQLTMQITIPASELGGAQPPTDSITENGKAGESALEVTAAIVKQMEQNINRKKIKLRPAS